VGAIWSVQRPAGTRVEFDPGEAVAPEPLLSLLRDGDRSEHGVRITMVMTVTFPTIPLDLTRGLWCVLTHDYRAARRWPCVWAL
jgi:hypothetical protein